MSRVSWCVMKGLAAAPPATAEKARNLLRHTQSADAVNITEDERYYLPSAVRACEQGVARTHLICRHTDGAILQELFTHEGIGTMVTEMPLELLRQLRIIDAGIPVIVTTAQGSIELAVRAIKDAMQEACRIYVDDADRTGHAKIKSNGLRLQLKNVANGKHTYKLHIVAGLELRDKQKPDLVLRSDKALDGVQIYPASTLANGMTDDQAQVAICDMLARDIVQAVTAGAAPR